MSTIANSKRAAGRTIGMLIAALALTGLTGVGSASALSAAPGSAIHFGNQVAGVTSGSVSITVTLDAGYVLFPNTFVGVPPGVSMFQKAGECADPGVGQRTCDVKYTFVATTPGPYNFGITLNACPDIGGACIHGPAPTPVDAMVIAGPVATVTTASPTTNPSTYGNSLVFGSHVAPAIGTGETPGSVQFFVDGVPFGAPVAVNPAGNVASPDASSLAVGIHAVMAVFTSSDLAHFNNSSSVAFNQTIVRASTTLIAAPTTSPGFVLKATLKSGVLAVAGETVKFTTGSTTLCTAVTNAAGVATCSIASSQQKIYALLATGRFTATFAATQNYAGSSANSQLVEGGKL